MDAIEQVKTLVTGMDRAERQKCLEVFSQKETEDETLKKNIDENVLELKVRVAELSTDDWELFCKRLRELSQGVKLTWRMIDRRREIERAERIAKKQAYVQEMVDAGYQFTHISVDGEDFIIESGKIVDRNDIPF